jgi:hypothetical protein
LEWRLLLDRFVRSTVLSVLLVAALGGGAAQARVTQPSTQLVSLQLPDGHGRPFDIASLRGSVVAVAFVSRYTQDEAARVIDALKTRPDVKVVTVVDFMGIPGFVHGYAKRKVAEADGDGRVQHRCDEHGSLRARFEAHPRKHVDIYVIDRDGMMRGRFEGAQQLDGALRLLDEVRGTRADVTSGSSVPTVTPASAIR